MTITTRMTRRQFFGKLGEGSLVVGFSLSPVAASMLAQEAHAASVASELTILSGTASGPLSENDAWLVIDHQGNVTLFSGKVEIGTGTQTAFAQIVAEELDVDVSAISYVQGDTSQTPDQGFTAGSKSIQVQGPLVRAAAATAFQIAIGPRSRRPRCSAEPTRGARRKHRDRSQDETPDKIRQTVRRPANLGECQPRRSGSRIRARTRSSASLFLASTFLTSAPEDFKFVSDIVLPGMLHGRVVRVNGGATGTSKPKNATSPSVDDSGSADDPGIRADSPASRISWASSQPTSGRRSRRRKRSKSRGKTAQHWCPTRSRRTCRQP